MAWNVVRSLNTGTMIDTTHSERTGAASAVTTTVPDGKRNVLRRSRWGESRRTDSRLRSQDAASALPALGFHTHTLGNEVEVVRAITAVADEAPGAVDVQIAQNAGGQLRPAAVGFVAAVDAICLPVEIEVDGGIDEKTAPLVVAAGARILVAGSAIFGKPDRTAAMQSIRDAVHLTKC